MTRVEFQTKQFFGGRDDVSRVERGEEGYSLRWPVIKILDKLSGDRVVNKVSGSRNLNIPTHCIGGYSRVRTAPPHPHSSPGNGVHGRCDLGRIV
jgi:hypothetical protein